MPSRDGPTRGKIIPFPAAAIRRPPSSAFVTQPVPATRVPPRGRVVLAWFALGSLLTALLAAFLLSVAASSAAHRRGAPPRAAAALRSTVPGSLNLLISGLDANEASADGSAARSDAIMLLHLDADREQAWVVSIPRETRVTVPGHGERRIDAVCALGGSSLLVTTVQRLTRLPVDHVAVIDRTGFRRITDGVGGVPLDLGPASPAGGLALELSGAMALDYVSESGASPAGDVEHIRREHRYLRALFAQLRERGTLADSPALRDLAASLGGSVRVDAGLDAETLRSLVDSTRRLRPEDVTFLVAPVQATRAQGGAAVVRPDAAGCERLWDALAHDEMPSLVAAHPELVSAGRER
jgi:LCP family protein required for cell wall assembly